MVATSETPADIDESLAEINRLFSAGTPREKVLGHAIREEVLAVSGKSVTLSQLRSLLIGRGIADHLPETMMEEKQLLRVGGATSGVWENRTYLAADDRSAPAALSENVQTYNVLNTLKNWHEAHKGKVRGREHLKPSAITPEELAQHIRTVLQQCLAAREKPIPKGSFPRMLADERASGMLILHHVLGNREELAAFAGIISAGGTMRSGVLCSALQILDPKLCLTPVPSIRMAEKHCLVARENDHLVPQDAGIEWALTGGIASTRTTISLLRGNGIKLEKPAAETPPPHDASAPTNGHPHGDAAPEKPLSVARILKAAAPVPEKKESSVPPWQRRATNIVDQIRMTGRDEGFEARTVFGSESPATDAMPGTHEKLDVLADRIRNGLPLFNAEDRRSYDDSSDD